jgi:hypothetical protein
MTSKYLVLLVLLDFLSIITIYYSIYFLSSITIERGTDIYTSLNISISLKTWIKFIIFLVFLTKTPERTTSV